MMTEMVYINKLPVELKPHQLIQSGGEGMVFAKGNAAIKIYHRPGLHNHQKLHDWMSSRLQTRLPSEVYGPLTLVKNGCNRIIGFQMRRLPITSRPLKRLSNPRSREKDGHDTRNILRIFQHMHATLGRIHQQGVIVGDLNDQNIFYDLKAHNGEGTSGTSFWIDVDSYQFGQHPCPVAMLPFVDPVLYGIDDLNEACYFSSSTDWYAYLTVLVKCLLQTHPYGGVHRKYKTIKARAASGISILNPAVTYPARARPIESLTDELLHHMSLIFDQGLRVPFPVHLLSQYMSQLVRCSQCGLSYPSQRPGCPACRLMTPAGRLPGDDHALERKVLLQVDGFIEYVSVLSGGRIAAVVRTGSSYRLVRVREDGHLDEKNLFGGHARYRFDSFGRTDSGRYLVASPAYGNQLLILDVNGSQPKATAMLETKQFRGRAVFAASPDNLFRIAGNMIMRGSMSEGQYVEEIIATAHKNQTIFWASPFENALAGYHQIFAERRFFAIDSRNTSRDLYIPPPVQGESLNDIVVTFGHKTLAIALDLIEKGKPRIDTYLYNFGGDLLHSFSHALDMAIGDNTQPTYPFTVDPNMPAPPFHLLPKTLVLSGGERLHMHPKGVLIQEANRLCLLRRRDSLDKVL